jgi:uncharacterized membrane protein
MAVTATATNQDKASEATAVGGRIMSIDVLRGFALCGMVLVHFAYLYGNAEAAENFITFFFNDMLADWGAAAFLMMMGISQVLSARRMEKPDNRLLFKRALLRGSYLFAVGLLMLLLAFGPGRMWRWDILTLMGFATVVLFFCRFLPSWSLVVLSSAVAILEFLIYFWEKADSKYSLEAILGALTARIVPGYKRSIRKTTGFGRAHVRP